MARVVSPEVAGIVFPASQKPVDASAVRAIAQAAVEVELFTIPLYMATLYSIQGTHQITGANDYYENRLWPGSGPTATQASANQQAFNVIFSVFIEEMLHLQLAANIATAIGGSPSFTSGALQDSHHGWICYGPDNTVIPRVVDLLDTTTFAGVKVDLGALSTDQLQLFLAIEQPESVARADIKDPGKYFPTVPFANWTATSTDADLPMFGTIGWMYQCYLDYLSLQYDDGTRLIDDVFTAGSAQNDMFNYVGVPPDTHTPEYRGFAATVTATDASTALPQILEMMDAITDQGEGHELVPPALLAAVQAKYRASRPDLENDYPLYSDSGQLLPPSASAIAGARCNNDGDDHYERFDSLLAIVDQVTTWPQWFQAGNQWTAPDLEDGTPSGQYGIPTTAEVAAALVQAGTTDRAEMYQMVSAAVTGALYGITYVLDEYWKPGETVSFPFPSMVGSGDRLSICWALFGEAPDLSVADTPDPNTLYHACQGLDLDAVGADCAAIAVFHSCRGSNTCKAQGGCGFVQKTTGGSVLCGGLAMAAKATCGSGNGGGGGDVMYSAPSDNKCGAGGTGAVKGPFGGCAVPISASQLLASSGTMDLFDFPAAGPPELIGTMAFEAGQMVHSVAYQAYLTVMQHRHPGTPPPPDNEPEPNLRRLVFPPST